MSNTQPSKDKAKIKPLGGPNSPWVKMGLTYHQYSEMQSHKLSNNLNNQVRNQQNQK